MTACVFEAARGLKLSCGFWERVVFWERAARHSRTSRLRGRLSSVYPAASERGDWSRKKKIKLSCGSGVTSVAMRKGW